jgi:hypothetical protein
MSGSIFMDGDQWSGQLPPHFWAVQKVGRLECVVSATDNISGSFSVVANLVADHILLPSLGINQLNMLEQVPVGTTTAATYAGGSSKMRLNLKWQG